MSRRSYDDAIELLNTLQTPFKILKERRDAGIRIDKSANEEMRKCLAYIGYSQSDLSNLNIVHVAGTKGKGSTCAYADSILSQYRKLHDAPRKVGLFTSPHLIAVRERIRINSAPISRELFAKYFFQVWDSLEAATAATHSAIPFVKPVYFRYLTLLSYHVFLQEGVDVAIYETGVGGEYDSTNIVDSPVATGISSLGIDHTFSLGETIDKIAWHKAGIQKKGVPSFTVDQPPEALEVVKARARERDVESFRVVGIDPRLGDVHVQPDADFQKSNASLAVGLVETVLCRLDPGFRVSSTSLPREMVDGIEKMVWRGRCETIEQGNVTWYLDGAHTADSIAIAVKWYGDLCLKQSGNHVLIFNQPGHREAIELLENLFKATSKLGNLHFNHVLFCPTATKGDIGSKKDFVNRTFDDKTIVELTLQKAFADKWQLLDPSPNTNIRVLPTIEDAFEYVRKLDAEGGKASNVSHALITGSVHLVGRALGALEGVDAI